jgi:hypothetical protein
MQSCLAWAFGATAIFVVADSIALYSMDRENK